MLNIAPIVFPKNGVTVTHSQGRHLRPSTVFSRHFSGFCGAGSPGRRGAPVISWSDQ
ncbi:hypothetical protein HMPREF1549_00506 [Actinomyces johnsonii F0510]|uniref:Uncharacterized protein n=1 Tax=Actinomyces johnsonii F0510 TaxID=1227262 RepID=U1Q115_9ACTO|nr:hypothetical protein HMPREF1549_00506 [Actinomyces johnsonii F0510]